MKRDRTMRKQIVLLAAAISLAASATRIGSAVVSEPAGLPNGGVWKDAGGVVYRRVGQ